MGGAHLLIVLPPSAVIVLPFTLSATDFSPAMGEGFRLSGFEEQEGGEEIFLGHRLAPNDGRACRLNRTSERPQIATMMVGQEGVSQIDISVLEGTVE